MVTAELAVVLPAVVLLLLALLAAGGAALTQVRVADAARAAARAVAVGEPQGRVVDVARHLAGDAAGVEVGRSDGYVVVTVDAALAGPLAAAGLRASATARALPEPGQP